MKVSHVPRKQREAGDEVDVARRWSATWVVRCQGCCGMCACVFVRVWGECSWPPPGQGEYLLSGLAAAQGTKVCGLTDKIFSGHILKFIQCINVNFKSEKKDMFQDIMVDVKGCANVYESFDRITAEDKFEGDNQYECEGHGKQVLPPPPLLLPHQSNCCGPGLCCSCSSGTAAGRDSCSLARQSPQPYTRCSL